MSQKTESGREKGSCVVEKDKQYHSTHHSFHKHKIYIIFSTMEILNYVQRFILKFLLNGLLVITLVKGEREMILQLMCLLSVKYFQQV